MSCAQSQSGVVGLRKCTSGSPLWQTCRAFAATQDQDKKKNRAQTGVPVSGTDLRGLSGAEQHARDSVRPYTRECLMEGAQCSQQGVGHREGEYAYSAGYDLSL